MKKERKKKPKEIDIALFDHNQSQIFGLNCYCMSS